MPVLNRSLARIYTPPTCTLEVTAQTSALSRWTRKPAVKSLQFLLSLEGQEGDRTPVELRGDQTQLAELSVAVGQYLQELLARRASELTIRSAPESPQVAVAEPPTIVSRVLQLRPHSLLNHELLLGHLATAETGPSITLKVSQLYDLATALDDYNADFQSLAELAVAPTTWRTALPLARSAAVVLLTVGLGATVWRLFQPEFIATNDAGRVPNAGPAQVPSPSPSKSLPSLRPPSLKPLVLPTVQLPSRSRAPGSVPTPDQPTPPNATSLSPGLNSPSPSTPSTLQRFPGEIALAPAPTLKPAPAPAPLPPAMEQAPSEPGLNQSFSAHLRTGASGAASDQANAPAAKAAPRSQRQQSNASSLFDTIPQVAEVRDSVAARWKAEPLPPKILEYRLTLNPNGTLAQVEPLGTSAQQYLTQLALPALGAPFVSAVSAGGRPIIRLVVSPDGTLQTFPDSGG
jgi:Domain of unknown function (DUF4335)